MGVVTLVHVCCGEHADENAAPPPRRQQRNTGSIREIVGTAGQALPKWNRNGARMALFRVPLISDPSIPNPSFLRSEFPGFPPSTRWRRDGGHKHGGQRHTWPSPSLGCTRLPHTKELVQDERRRGTPKPQRHPKGAQEARSVGRVGSGGGGRSCLPSKETKDHHQQRLQSRSKLAPAAAPAGPRWSWRRPR